MLQQNHQDVFLIVLSKFNQKNKFQELKRQLNGKIAENDEMTSCVRNRTWYEIIYFSKCLSDDDEHL